MLYDCLEVISDGQRNEKKGFRFNVRGAIPAIGSAGGTFRALPFLLYSAGSEMASIVSAPIQTSINGGKGLSIWTGPRFSGSLINVDYFDSILIAGHSIDHAALVSPRCLSNSSIGKIIHNIPGGIQSVIHHQYLIDHFN